ncbi:UNVERIFIED_CONTAM: hypothetical protein Sindi_2180900, partial [Sesamum indicum]
RTPLYNRRRDARALSLDNNALYSTSLFEALNLNFGRNHPTSSLSLRSVLKKGMLFSAHVEMIWHGDAIIPVNLCTLLMLEGTFISKITLILMRSTSIPLWVRYMVLCFSALSKHVVYVDFHVPFKLGA